MLTQSLVAARALMSEIEALAGQFARARASAAANAVAGANISEAKRRFMSAVANSSYCLAISDVARAIRISRQSAHRLAVSLERAGLVRLMPNGDDQRLLQLALTKNGRATLASVEEELNFWLMQRFYTLGTREIRELSSRLRALPPVPKSRVTSLRLRGTSMFPPRNRG